MLAVGALLTLCAGVFPAPFTRPLHLADPPLRGADVTVLQQLLRRIPDRGCALACGCGCSHVYDEATVNAVACFANRSSGVFDESVAHAVLSKLSSDGWADDGTPANASGHLYKLLIPVHRNRSIETTATLLDANNNRLYSFRCRTHGYDVDAAGLPIRGRPWPDFQDDDCPAGAAAQGCIGLNSFSTDGSTPTGLSEIDLNSPEDSAKFYGPYPVNRFVHGLSGNAQFLLSGGVCATASGDARPELPTVCARPLDVGCAMSSDAPLRSGILLHTGAWSNYSSWQAGKPMPSSAGCVHAYPESVEHLWRILVGLGVQVRPNTNGRLPYPYRPQGLAAVYEVGAPTG